MLATGMPAGGAGRDESERVIGAVELLRLAGARVADHDRGPEDRRRDLLHRRAHPDLGLELGRLVVVLEPLPEVELVLVDDAGPIAGHVRGADVVETLQPVGVPAEGEYVPGPVDVDELGDADRDRQVVDGGEVVDDLDLRREPPVAVLAEAQPRRRDVPLERPRRGGRRRARPQHRGRPGPCAARPARSPGRRRRASSSAATRRRPMKPGNPVTRWVFTVRTLRRSGSRAGPSRASARPPRASARAAIPARRRTSAARR